MKVLLVYDQVYCKAGGSDDQVAVDLDLLEVLQSTQGAWGEQMGGPLNLSAESQGRGNGCGIACQNEK